MAPPEDNPEMIFIFDVNGFIAGMHSVVAKKFVSPMFDFGGSKLLQNFVCSHSDINEISDYFDTNLADNL